MEIKRLAVREAESKRLSPQKPLRRARERDEEAIAFILWSLLMTDE